MLMKTHAYKIGQRVQFVRSADNGRQFSTSRFTIVKQMPADYRGLLYRIKADDETHERVVEESQLQSLF